MSKSLTQSTFFLQNLIPKYPRCCLFLIKWLLMFYTEKPSYRFYGRFVLYSLKLIYFRVVSVHQVHLLRASIYLFNQEIENPCRYLHIKKSPKKCVQNIFKLSVCINFVCSNKNVFIYMHTSLITNCEHFLFGIFLFLGAKLLF